MPQSMGEHADLMWVLIIGLIALVGAVASIAAAMFSRANQAEINIVKAEIAAVKEGQRDFRDDLIGVHNRIDQTNHDISCVKGDVENLKGRYEYVERTLFPVR